MPLLRRYWEWSIDLPLAVAEPNLQFAGRLAEYCYFNMDLVAAALTTLTERKLSGLPLKRSLV
jgi:UDP-galactopyranose mutase